MLGSLILYLKGMRIMMFQLSGFYYKSLKPPTSMPGRRPGREGGHADPLGTDPGLSLIAQRLQSSSFWGFIYRIQSLLRGSWDLVGYK